MPSIRSSSKTGDAQLTLFAVERANFVRCTETCCWIQRNSQNKAIVDAAGEVAKKVQELLSTILNGHLQKD